MTQTSHTPGPWIADDVHRDDERRYIFTENRVCPICAVNLSAPLLKRADRDRYRAEQEANARLIAAAPDLLSACKAVVATWEHGDLASAARACAAAIRAVEGTVSA